MEIKTRNRRLRVHKEGYTILSGLFLLLGLLNLTCWLLLTAGSAQQILLLNLLLSVIIFLFFLYFFRDPMRQFEIEDDRLVVAPADGRVVALEPTEVYEYFEGKKMMQVSIFMSVFNVHANWYPVDGTVKYLKHYDGSHRAAFLPKSSLENEHSTIIIESVGGHRLMMRQIAGALARRIVTYAKPEGAARVNHHCGFIKFGSRVDIFLPVDSEIFVDLNEHTRGNQTILARLPKNLLRTNSE
ncbi:MAG: phosphatidylserine decarboxylase family protein [Prevotellaceae bacterium]|jgi:phosphatidylserine decarboxylase|nr:phosphatidylserine decarboxylase family protein [Prevotellaceae bacterium]